MAKSGKNPKKCSFFITKSAVEPKNAKKAGWGK
jgi:hypothetical protein